MRTLLFVVLAGCAAFAQNKEIGYLIMTAPPPTEPLPLTNLRVRGAWSIGNEISFAWQVKTLPKGTLFVELPLFFMRTTTEFVSGYATPLRAANIFTPGVRYKLPLGNRWSLYGVGGFGVAGYAVDRGTTKDYQWSGTPVFDAGGGIDYRVTKLLSIRMEARDFIAVKSGLGGTKGHNHLVWGMLGIGIHF